ncbi:MAG: hypothetical protein IT423_00195, partial [Pirellulaceae bacterium]|nr:hypothetical protein [Pirellulaceae bacterium]
IGQEAGSEAGLEGSAQAEPIAVMGCAAHHESEELVLKVLSYSLDQDNIAMRWTDTKALPSDVQAWVEAQQPAVIVIAIMPPDGFIQAKYLCQQLKQCSPKSQIVVAYFGKLRSYDAILVKFRAAGASFFATSLNQTRSQVTNALKRTKKGSGLFFR